MVFESGQTFTIKVKTNAKKNDIDLNQTPILVSITALPIDGKANKAIEKLFKKLLKCRVQIIKGLKQPIKVISVL